MIATRLEYIEELRMSLNFVDTIEEWEQVQVILVEQEALMATGIID
jgi:hypothetical protein